MQRVINKNEIKQNSMFKLKKQTPKKIQQKFNKTLKNKQNEMETLLQAQQNLQIMTFSKFAVNNKHLVQLIPFFKYIQTSYINQIYLGNPLASQLIQKMQMLVEISHVKYQNLLKISLHYLNLQGIQPLTWIDTPKLNSIKIQQWPSFSLKPLAKTNFRNLQSLQIYQEHISSYQTKFVCNRMMKNKSNDSWRLISSQRSNQSFICYLKSTAKEIDIGSCLLGLEQLKQEKRYDLYPIQLNNKRIVDVLVQKYQIQKMQQ